MPSFSPTVYITLLGVVGIWLGFPNVVWHVPILVLLYPISLYALGINSKNYSEALRKGWLLGLLGNSVALYWLAIPIHNVGRLPWGLAVPCALAIGAYVGLYGGAFSLISFLFKQRSTSVVAKCVALACTWYALEVLRGVLFTGFAWLSIGTAFAPWPSMIQGASLVGGYALSAIYICAALLLFEAFKTPSIDKKISLRYAIIGLILLIIPIVFGKITLLQNPMQAEKQDDQAQAFILVEGNIDQNVKWEPETQKKSINIYQDLTLKGIEELEKNHKNLNAIIIWPETAMPFFLEHHPEYTPNLVNFVKQIQLPLLVGAPGIVRYTAQKREIFNRAYSIDANGQLVGFYDKMHLVPFGEYVPSWLLFNFLEPLLQGIGNFTPGKQSEPLVVSGNASQDKLALGMLICYESIFPEIARQRVADGANILVNISNDGWFGDSAAPMQHLQLSMMRAVEQGRYLVRSTNTGISAIVDDFGRLTFKGEQFKAQSLIAYANPREKHSVFFQLGPWMPLIILGIFLAALFLAIRNQKN